MMNEKVSIVVPVYRAQNVLERCVDSIVNGLYTNIEVILVEDHSSDQSWEVCKKLRDKYSVVKILQNNENRGVSYTRNQALGVATGDLIMFVDSDDWVEPGFVSDSVNAYRESGAGLVVFGYINHDECNTGRVDRFGWEGFDGIKAANVQNLLEPLYRGRLLQQLWNKVFVAECIRKNNIRFDESMSMGEDFRFVLQYISAMNHKQVAFMNHALYHYIRDNGQSLMSTFGQEKIDGPLVDMRLMYELDGRNETEIEQSMSAEKERQIHRYAYSIMHNTSLSSKEKKNLIYELAGDEKRKIYWENKIIHIKERVAVMVKYRGSH